MASFSNIKVRKLNDVNEFFSPEDFSSITTALSTNGATSASFGACFDMNERDEKIMLLVQNVASSGDAKSITIKAGNGIQGVNDLVFNNLGAGKFSFIQIESGRFKNVKENEELKELSSATESTRISAKGKVFITGTDSNIKIAVFKMP